MNAKLNERRQRAKQRLEQQLKTGKKIVKTEQKVEAVIDLEEADVKRIKREIETLKTRITN